MNMGIPRGSFFMMLNFRDHAARPEEATADSQGRLTNRRKLNDWLSGRKQLAKDLRGRHSRLKAKRLDLQPFLFVHLFFQSVRHSFITPSPWPVPTATHSLESIIRTRADRKPRLQHVFSVTCSGLRPCCRRDGAVDLRHQHVLVRLRGAEYRRLRYICCT